MATRSFARSLYWRIGLGFILFLAITLVLQVLLFIWVAGEREGGMPERMGRDFAELVASEFEAALARDPELDLRGYARQRGGAARHTHPARHSFSRAVQTPRRRPRGSPWTTATGR